MCGGQWCTRMSDISMDRADRARSPHDPTLFLQTIPWQPAGCDSTIPRGPGGVAADPGDRPKLVSWWTAA